MKKKLVLTLLLVGVITVGAIGTIVYNRAAHSNDNKIHIAASFYPLYDIAKQVGGNNVIVQNITPAGAEPHDYEPSAKALADAHNTDMFLYNGGMFESWTQSFLQGYTGAKVKAGRGVTLLNNDPHFWLDPVLAQKIAANIRDELIQIDPTHKVVYANNTLMYNRQLQELDAAFQTQLATCKTRTIVTAHNAFAYLAARYNMNIISIAGISPDEEPSAGKLAEITRTVHNQGIRYIFFESLVSPRLADTIAAETGAKTLVLDPLEGLTDSDQKQGKDYVKKQYENLANLRTALSCK